MGLYSVIYIYVSKNGLFIKNIHISICICILDGLSIYPSHAFLIISVISFELVGGYVI